MAAPQFCSGVWLQIPWCFSYSDHAFDGEMIILKVSRRLELAPIHKHASLWSKLANISRIELPELSCAQKKTTQWYGRPASGRRTPIPCLPFPGARHKPRCNHCLLSGSRRGRRGLHYYRKFNRDELKGLTEVGKPTASDERSWSRLC
jgi:hypothetical protein